MRLKPIPTTSAVVHVGNLPAAPRRRGRPPKSLTAARPYKAQPVRRKPPPKSTRKSFPAASTKRKRAVSISSSSASEFSDIDAADDTRSAHFPTFVSASALSSASSSDSDSGSGGFDTDSSIEAEEENFILAEERARVRRELLGSNNNPPNKRRDNWVIQPRKTSVGDPSDVDMDDSTVDEDEDEDGEEDDDESEEEDDADVEEEEEETDTRPGCTGMVTGWSDDEESSLDADLFFANLTDTSSSSSSDDEIPELLGEALSRLGHVQDLPFEVTEGWDGQVVFTNGLTDGQGQGSLDAEFDARAMQFIVESSTSTSEDVDAEMDEWGMEADDEDEIGGDTTDEDLVGVDDLPNEKAMQLFNLPFATALSSINPMSTMRRAMIVERQPSEEMDEDDGHKPLGGPRQGAFHLIEEEETKTVVVNADCKDIPSPHPRRTRSRRFTIGAPPQFLLPRALSPSPPTTLITSPEPDHPVLAGPIELDDVLDSSFLDGGSSSSEHSATTPTTLEHMRNLTRWDVVSVGAFRRKDVEHTSESEYGGVMKSSPLAAMLWQNKLGMTEEEPRKSMKRSAGAPIFHGKGKGKSVGKVWHHHHAHYANGKSGRAGSSQRNFGGAGGSSPIP
ncbi:hypothetical protein BDZ89DRAFT_1057823 [Hymenopellis radicata]|nr:hypothetical protein BDZ89DRAFT_1057823 [Hymenopellis radicata]